MTRNPPPPSAAEEAIRASRYATKPIYSLLPPAPSYSPSHTSFTQGLQVAAGFFKWAHARLLREQKLLYLKDEIEGAIAELLRLHEGLGEVREPSPKEVEGLERIYQGAIRRVLPLERCSEYITSFHPLQQIKVTFTNHFPPAEELLAADFAQVYHQLQSVASVEGIRVLSMAIVVKGFYAGWHNLTGWQQLSVGEVEGIAEPRLGVRLR